MSGGAGSENVVALLGRLARASPRRVALVEPGGAHLSFGELEERTARLAGGLRGLGARPGDRLLVLHPMSIPLYLTLLSLFRAELTAVLLDPSAPRVEALLGRLGLKGFVGSPRAHLTRLLHRPLRELDLYVSSGPGLLPSHRLDALEGAPLAPGPVVPGRPALLTFTTGSTGTPKPLARTHAFLLAQHRVLAEHMGLGEGDVDLPTLPVFLLNSLAAGATCVLPDADLRNVSRVRPERVIRQLVQHGCTTTSGSPAFLGPIARALRAAGGTLPRLRRVFTGGAPVAPRVLEDLVAVAPNARVEVLYGASEAEPIASIGAPEVLEDTARGEAGGRGRCVGRPVPGVEVRIAALEGPPRVLGPGEVGEVLVTGPHVSESYFEAPEADAVHKLREGPRTWHRTGDTGYLDGAGRLWLAGRVNAVAAGRHPLLVEVAAEARPWVVRAALVEVDGEAVLACQVREPPARWQEQLREACGVDRVVGLRRLPVDPRHNAKVDRRRVRALLTAPGGARLLRAAHGLWSLALVALSVALAPPAHAAEVRHDCFRTHVEEAIALNEARRPLYAQRSAGASLPVSDALLAAERATLPIAALLDWSARAYQQAGIPLLCAELVPMSRAPAFLEVEAGREARPLPLDVAALQGRLSRALERGGVWKVRPVLEAALARLAAVPGRHCMLRHLLESMLRAAWLAPSHAVRARRAGLPSPMPLSEAFLWTHVLSLGLAAELDARAAPVQAQGVAILCGDLPPVPPV